MSDGDDPVIGPASTWGDPPTSGHGDPASSLPQPPSEAEIIERAARYICEMASKDWTRQTEFQQGQYRNGARAVLSLRAPSSPPPEFVKEWASRLWVSLIDVVDSPGDTEREDVESFVRRLVTAYAVDFGVQSRPEAKHQDPYDPEGADNPAQFEGGP